MNSVVSYTKFKLKIASLGCVLKHSGIIANSTEEEQKVNEQTLHQLANKETIQFVWNDFDPKLKIINGSESVINLDLESIGSIVLKLKSFEYTNDEDKENVLNLFQYNFETMCDELKEGDILYLPISISSYEIYNNLNQINFRIQTHISSMKSLDYYANLDSEIFIKTEGYNEFHKTTFAKLGSKITSEIYYPFKLKNLNFHTTAKNNIRLNGTFFNKTQTYIQSSAVVYFDKLVFIRDTPIKETNKEEFNPNKLTVYEAVTENKLIKNSIVGLPVSVIKVTESDIEFNSLISEDDCSTEWSREVIEKVFYHGSESSLENLFPLNTKLYGDQNQCLLQLRLTEDVELSDLDDDDDFTLRCKRGLFYISKDYEIYVQ